MTRRERVEDIVSAERDRLMKAEAVLGCVAFALLYEDWHAATNRPSFSDALAVAQELVNKAVERLGASDVLAAHSERD